jgi:hypothetical protein
LTEIQVAKVEPRIYILDEKREYIRLVIWKFNHLCVLSRVAREEISEDLAPGMKEASMNLEDHFLLAAADLEGDGIDNGIPLELSGRCCGEGRELTRCRLPLETSRPK